MTEADEPLRLTDGRYVVPANRWDLLDSNAFRPARVGVVIPYYEQPAQLTLVLRALELQDYPRELIDVVVADDGSADQPEVSGARLNVTVVRQEDRGFRAAAARNLGAAATTAEVLCFLDADTIPEPGYITAITRLPTIVPDAVVVGRRRHADLTGWTPEQLPAWWSGEVTPPLLAEPDWLTAAYRDSADLLMADHRSYRHLISAVMCCSHEFYEDIGGMDESFCEYGGEDWEFAHRAMVNGAVLQHARGAVAWHDGPDWGDREVADRPALKNREALAVARLIPDPAARRFGIRYEIPEVAIEVDVCAHSPGSLVETLSCYLHDDVGIWLTGPTAADLLAELRTDDQRIHAGPVPAAIAHRCRVIATTTGRPVLTAEAFRDLLRRCGQRGVREVRVADDVSAVTLRASWAVHRLHRWTHGPVRLADPADADRLGAVVVLQADSVGLGTADIAADLSW